MTNQITANIATVQKLIIAFETRYARSPGAIKLLAVSKGQDVEAIGAAYQAGLHCFGENYLSEALKKIEALQHLDIEWHFIGHIQSNKTKEIAKHFDWVHSLDSDHLAKRLNDQRPSDLPPLNVLIQVNIDADPAKSGISVTALAAFAKQLQHYPRLQLRGLMTILAYHKEFMTQRAVYRKLRKAWQGLCDEGIALDTLSMGMSHDFEAAIAEGATLVRIGQAIFGPRT